MNFNRFCQAALCATALMCAPLPAQAATIDQWRRDIDQIVEHISAIHPRPWGEIGRLSFLRRAEQLKAQLPTLTEEQRVARTMQLVALIGDRATSLEPDNPTFNQWYPVRFYQFEDRYYITAAHRSVVELAGAEVLQINGASAAQAAETARSLLAANGEMDRMERLFALHNSGLMRGASVADAEGRLRVRVRLRGGRVVERVLAPMATDGALYAQSGGSPFIWADLPEVYGTPLGAHDDWVTGIGGATSMSFRTPDETRAPFIAHRRVFYARALPRQDAYYMQINYMSNSTQETFEDFFRRAMREVDTARPRRLIIDLRFNAGGDGSKGLMMAHEIVRRGPQPPWRELYVLVGRRTNGAATSAIDAFVRNTPTTLVGEATGDQYNSISDARTFLFADTHIRLNVAAATSQFSESSDLSETIVPDVPAVWTFADWSAGRDPAVDAILAGREMRSIAVIARMDGGAAARALHNARRPQFERYAWWRPMRFNTVKTVGYDLLRANRPADAIEMFALMTELYPDEWNSWESLGRAQTAADDLAAARASYRCALALDPENFDAGDLRTALAAAAPGEAPTVPPGCPTTFRAS